MRSRLPLARRTAAAVLVAVVTALAGGCAVGSADDETSPAPRRTVTVAPSVQPSPATAVPSTLPPVPDDRVGPDDVVWVQGSVLHVGADAWDLAPRSVDAFVVVRGGVYFLDDGGLWFTDTVTVKDTGVSGATALRTDVAGTGLLVTRRGGTRAFSVATGDRVAPRSITPATTEDRLGRAATLRLRPERSDLTSGGPVTARLGPGRYGVVDAEGEPLTAFLTATRQPVALTGTSGSGSGFELVRWTGPSRFYGLVLRQERPAAVVGCDVALGTCRTWGRVADGGSLLFGSGS